MSRPTRRPKPWALELVAQRFLGYMDKPPEGAHASAELDDCLQWLLDEARRERRKTERKRKEPT